MLATLALRIDDLFRQPEREHL